MDMLINDREENPSSLDGLYTDFDKWLFTYRAYYQRSISKKEYDSETQLPIVSKRLQNTDDLLLEVFIADILLKQRHKTHTAIQPFSNFSENDGFMFHDFILYRLLNKNGDKSIVYKMVRSKL